MISEVEALGRGTYCCNLRLSRMRIFLRLPIESLPARSRQAEPAAGERGQSNFTAARDLQEPFVKNSPATLTIARKSALFRWAPDAACKRRLGPFRARAHHARSPITAARSSGSSFSAGPVFCLLVRGATRGFPNSPVTLATRSESLRWVNHNEKLLALKERKPHAFTPRQPCRSTFAQGKLTERRRKPPSRAPPQSTVTKPTAANE